jgi:putative hydrolase of the HAD superfamily
MKDIVFIDSGDTLVDETTQDFSGGAFNRGLVLSARLFPSSAETIRSLHEAHIKIALVADGEEESFRNVLERQHGLWDYFDAHIISSNIGEHKPSAKMFQAAMDALGLSDADKGRIVMVGNNLSRDVAGAKRFGITAVWIDISDPARYSHSPANKDEEPDYTIHEPRDLLDLLKRI